MLIGEVAAEGFVDAVTPDLATASTTLIPRITEQTTMPGRSRGRWRARWLPMTALGLLAVLLIAGVAVAMGTTGAGQVSPVAVDTPVTTPSVTAGGVAFGPKGSAEATDCVGHAYGDVQVWLAQHACVDLIRSAYQTTVDNQRAAVAIAVVTFHDQSAATAFADVAKTPGTGGITDLIQDGSSWPDGPKSFDGAAYTVVVHDTSVRLTEVVWIDRKSTPTDPGLTKLAAAANSLPGTP
jgi:hypothetical protein